MCAPLPEISFMTFVLSSATPGPQPYQKKLSPIPSLSEPTETLSESSKSCLHVPRLGSILVQAIARSSTERVTTPGVSNDGAKGSAPPTGQRPIDVRIPTQPV